MGLPNKFLNVWRRVSEQTNVDNKKKNRNQYLYLIRTGVIVEEPQLTWRQKQKQRIMKKAWRRHKQRELRKKIKMI